MTDDERAFKYALERKKNLHLSQRDTNLICLAYLHGLKDGKPKWHNVFGNTPPYSYEYWDLPQDNLPKIENFYFVKLKNGFIKVCELKYCPWSRMKYFYDLHGGKQSNVVEWLDYPKETEDDRENSSNC